NHCIIYFFNFIYFVFNRRCYFFFQAEDGIRDFHVTGVQTCALPIFASSQDFSSCNRAGFSSSIEASWANRNPIAMGLVPATDCRTWGMADFSSLKWSSQFTPGWILLQ